MKLLLSTALAVLLCCGYASAKCGPSPQVALNLTLKYGEQRIEAQTAIPPGGNVAAEWGIWVNPQTGTWSFTGTRNGITCLFAAGNEYNGQSLADFLVGRPT